MGIGSFIIKSVTPHILGLLQDLTSEKIINRKIGPKTSIKIIDYRDIKVQSTLWTTRDNDWVKVENYPLSFTNSKNYVIISNESAVNSIAPAFIITPRAARPGSDWAASVTIPATTAFSSKPDNDIVNGYNVFEYKIEVHLHDTYVSVHYIVAFIYNGIYPSGIPDKEIQDDKYNYWLVPGETYKKYHETKAHAGFTNKMKWNESVNI